MHLLIFGYSDFNFFQFLRNQVDFRKMYSLLFNYKALAKSIQSLTMYPEFILR